MFFISVMEAPNDHCEVPFRYPAYFALAPVGWMIRHSSDGSKLSIGAASLGKVL